MPSDDEHLVVGACAFVLFLCPASPAIARVPCWLAFLVVLPGFLGLVRKDLVMTGKVWLLNLLPRLVSRRADFVLQATTVESPCKTWCSGPYQVYEVSHGPRALPDASQLWTSSITWAPGRDAAPRAHLSLLSPSALEQDPWRLRSTRLWKALPEERTLLQGARGQPSGKSAERSRRLPTRPPARGMGHGTLHLGGSAAGDGCPGRPHPCFVV